MTNKIIEAIEAAHRWQADFNIFTQIENPDSAEVSADGPLRGVPIAVKDLIDHAGRVTTLGSAFYRETPDHTAVAIQRLLDAGAVVVGRTGLHEFAFGFSSENPHFGPVRNPWDRNTSPGGSSGGSGAAVGAGIVPIALGTDTGGSVRVPAALCGCFGLKVTYGAIPLDGVFPLVPSIDTVGPLADSMSSLELAYRVMADDARPLPTATSLRIGVPQPWVEMAPMSAHVAEFFRSASQAIADLGHQVHPVDVPDVFPARPINYAIAAEVMPVHQRFRAQGMPYGEEVKMRLDEADRVTPAQFEEGREWQAMIRQRFADVFDTVDLLITPTVASMRKVIGVDDIDGEPYRKVLSWFSSVVNHALVPAMAMPLADTGAPPVSLQLIGPAKSEPVLIAVGRQLEQAGLVKFVSAALSESSPEASN